MEYCDGVLDFDRSMGGVVMVPVDTIPDREGAGWNTWADPEEIACSSGVLMMISEARLISDGLGGDCDSLSGKFEGAEMARGPSAAARGWLLLMLKALSVTFSAAGFPTVGELLLSKSNLTPCSCKIENWSSVGNLVDSSSLVFAAVELASSAAKGSPFVTRIGEGLGLGAWLGGGCGAGAAAGAAAGNLPLRMGAISGMTLSFCDDGGENTAPTTGAAVGLEAAGRGASRESDGDLPA